MANLMTIAECLDQLVVLTTAARTMRNIVDDKDKPTEERYQAVIVEEGYLDIIQRYIKHIEQLKGLSVRGTVNQFNSKR